MEIVFRSPFYLWSLIIVPLVVLAHFLSLMFFKQKAIKFSNFIALARVSEKIGVSSNYTILILRVLVLISIIFAISGTSVYYSGDKIDADYIVAIDSSASMLAEDFSPNRFEASKNAAIEFVNSLPIYSSVGVVAFSGTSYLINPLTNDKKIIKDAINKIQITSSGGTDSGGAIITGVNLLWNSKKPKVIILLTDGRSNVGVPIPEAIQYAVKNNILINTIAIGTDEGYFLEIDDTLGPLGINNQELNLIANSTSGKFYYPKNSFELVQIYDDIAKSKKENVSLDLTFFLLIFILGTLFLEWILINTKYRILP